MDLGAPDIRIHYLRVTNHLDVPFTDRHDGVPVSIPAGKSENLPLDMAEHFFGYQLDAPKEVMFRHVCKRQGWNTPAHLKEQENGKTLAMDLFDKIELSPVIYKMVEAKVDTDAPIPADPEIPEVPAEQIAPLPPRKRA